MGSFKPPSQRPAASLMAEGETSQRRARCPICTAPTEAEFRPFCSRRCADVDLSRWLRGGYAIPGNVEVDEDGDDAAAASTGSERPAGPPHEDDERS